LGTGAWDDVSLTREPPLHAGWYPAPPPASYQQFVARYQRVYGPTPPRIASLGDGAVRLAVAPARLPSAARHIPQTLTNEDGFAGLDGIFRFHPDGSTDRGLAVLEIRPTGAVVIDPAPESFTPRLF